MSGDDGTGLERVREYLHFEAQTPKLARVGIPRAIGGSLRLLSYFAFFP